jgi:hypothetical protein
MALQRMILVPPELWEKHCQAPLPPPPVKTIMKSKDHSYNKWTRVRLHQDPYLKTEKLKREPIAIPIIETKRKTGPFIKGEEEEEEIDSESATNSPPVHSMYIHNVLKRKLSHDPTFGVYRDDTDGSFKIGRSSFKYNSKNVFVDGKKYKATQGLWELLTKSKPDVNIVTFQDRQAYKQILLQSNAHRVNYSPTGKIKANKGIKYTRFISRLFADKKEVPWESA